MIFIGNDNVITVFAANIDGFYLANPFRIGCQTLINCNKLKYLNKSFDKGMYVW